MGLDDGQESSPPFNSSIISFFHLREGNPKWSSIVPGGHTPDSLRKEAVKNRHFLCIKPSGSRMGLQRVGRTQIPALVSGGTGPGLLHLQQSLNKSRMSGAEVRGGWAGRKGQRQCS